MGGYGHLLSPDASLVSQLQSDVLRPIYEVNAEFLDALAQCPASESLCAEVVAIRADAVALSVRARDSLVRGPLLVNFAFDDCEKWSRAHHQVRGSKELQRTSLGLPGASAARLAQSTLLLTWYLLHAYPGISPILLGVSPPCAAIICDLSIATIQDIAKRHRDWLQPRWNSTSAVWASLLDVARQQETSRLGVPAFRALQLFTARYNR
jgi:hypothetical protein